MLLNFPVFVTFKRFKLAANFHSKFELLNSPPSGSKINNIFEINEVFDLTINKTENSVGFYAGFNESKDNFFIKY